ncbi:hypothetical protein DPMN_048373 [Dreissena polymorpha]|uniref:Beta-hexosaminidase n=2 Tax=Dreissena polymorpha TaxID=45954 RepID=A0A9D4DDB0_DREPO|nr:hypothetical protein DPMN_048373 [Dreissena polymorpha]
MAGEIGVIVLFSCCLAIAICNVQQQYREKGRSVAVTQTSGMPWPMPKQMTVTTIQRILDVGSFQFLVSSSTQRCDIIDEAFVRYRKYIFGNDDRTLKFKTNRKPRHGSIDQEAYLDTLQINIASGCDGYPSEESNEAYTLMISQDASTATINANEVWGALRGLETFSQLVYQNDMGLAVINATIINDAPRFQHRGLLLDTSRHFLSLDILKENLELMAQNKFNVFHWHIVDDQSFPYESYYFPDMSRKGAYSVRHVYTHSDVKEIIEFARVRGIRVIPEYDSPGHSQSWGLAITNLLTKCYKDGQLSGDFGPIDPSVNSTFQFLQNFFLEISQVFPDKFIHLGGDEVPFDCWESNPDITSFMTMMGYGKNYALLEEYYMQRLIDIVQGLNKGYMIWQEVIDNGAKVAPDTIVHIWKGGYQDELTKVTKLGYNAVLSAPWYLNYISYGSDWRNYYQVEPLNFNGTDAQKALVIGGETCMWGEYVDNTNLIPRMWPRAASVGERLWSPMEVNSADAATSRLEEHRCRLLKRGFPVQPVNGPGFCSVEL